MWQYAIYLVSLGAIVQLIGIFSYIKDTVRGNTKPNKMTWLLWAVAPLIGAAAAISDGVTWAVLPVLAFGFASCLVFIFSFVNKNSYWKLGRLDYYCGGFSLLALILWWITKIPEIAILFAIVSDGLAALPTLIKAWKYPETENAGPFTMGILNSLTSFTAITKWTFSASAFPIYLVIMNIAITFAILRHKIFQKNILLKK